MDINTRYFKGIKPYVDQELSYAKDVKVFSNPTAEFKLLESAHVLGRASSLLNT
jgi:hypothetical protein